MTHFSFDPPPFVPHPLLVGGHGQTLGGFLFPGRLPPHHSKNFVVELDDGDKIVLHDTAPDSWRSGDRIALLLHGLGGSHQSPYMRRISAKLVARGVRAFRMDLRGAGAGEELARRPYHSGRSADAKAVLEFLAELCPRSPCTMVGFSLGGNIVLKLLGEVGPRPPGSLDSAAAVCPPVDLEYCSQALARPTGRVYDRYFVRQLLDQVRRREQLDPGSARELFTRRPRRLREFDDLFTARIWEFGDVATYYAQSSALPLLGAIALPTLILASRDDPLIPPGPLESARVSECTRVMLTHSGGHLGYIGRAGVDPDRRWMDWRIVDWVTRDWRH